MNSSKQGGPPILTADGAANAPLAGTTDNHLRNHLLLQLLPIMGGLKAKSEEDKGALLSSAVAALNGLAPCDAGEGMLGVQMIATHHAAMECLRHCLYETTTRDRNLVHAERFLSLYVRQLQAMDRRRGSAEQQMSVGTVNVEAGAQAIVGNVTPGAGRGEQSRA